MGMGFLGAVGLVALVSFSAAAAPVPTPEVSGKLPAERFTAVAIEWRNGEPTFHAAKDVRDSYGEAWRGAVNRCGGVSRNCYVLRSWGKYGCLVVYKGRSARGNPWIGHSLALLPPTYGNGAMEYLLEDAGRQARNICNFHAHYDERGRIYDATLSYSSGYCSKARVICSAEFQDGEFESP